MPPGEKGYCVVKRGEEHHRGNDDALHEWATLNFAYQWLRRIGGLLERFGNANAAWHYYVAGPDGKPVDEHSIS